MLLWKGNDKSQGELHSSSCCFPLRPSQLAASFNRQIFLLASSLIFVPKIRQRESLRTVHFRNFTVLWTRHIKNFLLHPHQPLLNRRIIFWSILFEISCVSPPTSIAQDHLFWKLHSTPPSNLKGAVETRCDGSAAAKTLHCCTTGICRRCLDLLQGLSDLLWRLCLDSWTHRYCHWD